MIQINNIKINIDTNLPLKKAIIQKLNCPQEDLIDYQIIRKSLDARKETIFYNYSLIVNIKNEKKYYKHKDCSIYQIPPKKKLICGRNNLTNPIVIVGFGPAGIFCALKLCEYGFKPIIVEQGKMMDERIKDVENYWHNQQLNPLSNVQFGEGGAGAFSDGKLTTRIKDQRVKEVLDLLIRHGANPEIAYLSSAHLGTDKLRTIIPNIRKYLIQKGCQFRFNTKMNEVLYQDNQCIGIKVNENEIINSNNVILAIGHSSQSTYEFLANSEVNMEAKPFAVGVRIEHLQSFINKTQYKSHYNNPNLPAGEYHLSYTTSNGKGVYSFCMCPGGEVVASSDDLHQIVTNGMSYSQRAGVNANSALLVQVNSDDYGTGLLDGLYYQKELEKKAYEIAKNQQAPVQLVANYLNSAIDNQIGQVIPTYSCGYHLCDLHQLFSNSINLSLQEALHHFEQIMPGFTSEGSVMSGVETRSSAPLRIVRDKDSMQSNIKGIYPCGEGCGYAGGIVSSAVDGIKIAEKIISEFLPQ